MTSSDKAGYVARVYREYRGFTFVIGPWAARFSFDRRGWLANGSHWFSGWHRWEDDLA